MIVQRSQNLRIFFHYLLCVVAVSVRSVDGEATLSGPYPAAIAPDANYRGYGSDLVNRGYSITPAALAYHSSDPVSSVLSQVRDDDVTLISPLAQSPQSSQSLQSPPNANLVRYIILKEYHVLRDGTMVPAASETIIGKTDGIPQISQLGGYSSSSSDSSGYGAPPVSSGYSSPSAPSSGSSGYSAPSGGSGGYSSPSGGSSGYSSPSVSTGTSSGYSEPPNESNGNQRPSARRPSIDEPVIEITRVELPEESDDLSRATAAGASGNSESGRNNNNEDSSTNEVNDDDDNADDDNDDAGDDDDNADDSDYNDDDGGGEQDEDEDEENETNSQSRTQVSSGNKQSTNNNRPQQQAQRGNTNSGTSGSGNNRNSAGGRTGTNNDSRFQVTPVQGVVLGNRNPNANRPQSQSPNTRGQNSVLTDAFMFSEPSAEATGTTPRPSTGSSNRNSNRNSNSRRNNNSSRNRNRNNRNRNRNRNRSRNNRRRNRNRGNATTTASPPPASSEELAPIVLPTSASPQLQEALRLVAQFAQQQADLLSRTKEQAKNIAGSVFQKLTIPGYGFGAGGNASAPYPQSQSPVPAQEVSITRLREIDPANNTDTTANGSSNQLPEPSTADQPPSASVSSPQTTYGAPGGGLSGFHATKLNLHQAKANIHQQLAGLKSGFKAGILNHVQNTVAAVNPKGETGTSTTSPSPIYGPPAPVPSFQIIKAVKGHFVNKGKGVATLFASKGQRVVGHFTNKGTQFVGHFANKGRTVKNHFVSKGARLTQKASTLVDAKHMHLQNVIKHIQTIFQHNPALTAW